jgi:hypothetical protein
MHELFLIASTLYNLASPIKLQSADFYLNQVSNCPGFESVHRYFPELKKSNKIWGCMKLNKE